MKTNLLQNNIPQGWKKETLGHVSKVGAGFGFPIKFQGKKNGDYPFAKVSDMNLVGNEKYIYRAENYLNADDLKKVKVKTFPAGTVIFPKVGAALLTNKRRILKVEAIIDNNVMGLIPLCVSSEFLYYWMFNFDVTQHVTNGALPSINQGYVENLEFLLPADNEQQKIAEILGAVDEDIAKTQEVIEATEKLKRGLMQQLFTRGIGHTKFKETKIGSIPEEWDVVSIRNSSIKLIDGDRGANYPKQGDFSNEGFCLFLSAKNVSKKGFVFDEVSFISQEKDLVLRKGKLERGDIILTSRGTVGNVAYYNEKIPFDNVRINSGMLIVRHGEKFDPVFLYRYFSSPQMEANYLSMGSGSAQPQLPIGSFEQVVIPVIPIDEQKQIANIISEIDEKISVNKKLKEKLILLKKGLMQDLLSGKVRTI